MTSPARLRPTPGCTRPRVARAKLPNAARATVQRSQGQDWTGPGAGRGLGRSAPTEGAVVVTFTVTFVEELLRVNELGETVQAAYEGAPVQVKDMF